MTSLCFNRHPVMPIAAVVALVGGLTGVAGGAVTSTTPIGSTIYVVNATSRSMTPIDATSRAVGRPIPLATNPIGIAAAPNGKTLYILAPGNDETGSDGTLFAFTTATGTLGRSLPAGSFPNTVVIAPNGTTAYVLNGINAATTAPTTPATVLALDLATHARLASFKVGTLPDAMAIAPDGKLLYVVDTPPSNTGGPSAITPIDLATGTAAKSITLARGATAPVESGVAFTPNSATAYVITSAGVRTVTTATGAIGRLVGLGTQQASAVAVTPNGSEVAIVASPLAALEQGSPYGANATFTLVSTATGAIAKVITLGDEPGDVAWQVAMSPDSSTAYVLEEANAPHPGELYEINLATDTASAPIRVGVGASGFVVVGGTDPLAPVPAGVATRLPVTATVEKKLIAAFARVKKLPLDGVRLNPAYVVYAYDPTTKTYWSEANFSPTSKDTTSVALSFEDAGGLGIFSKGVSGAWTFRGASLPITCAEEKYVPAAVLSVWSVPLTSSAC